MVSNVLIISSSPFRKLRFLRIRIQFAGNYLYGDIFSHFLINKFDNILGPSENSSAGMDVRGRRGGRAPL